MNFRKWISGCFSVLKRIFPTSERNRRIKIVSTFITIIVGVTTILVNWTKIYDWWYYPSEESTEIIDNKLKVDSIFKKSDSITFNVLITHFEDFITNRKTNCIGRSIQERIELINSNKNRPSKIIVKYADSIPNPKTRYEAGKVRKIHNADYLIYGLVTIKDDTCNFGSLRYRHDIDESLTAKSPAVEINPTKYDSISLSVSSPEQIIEGKLEIEDASLDTWIIALSDLKFDNQNNALLDLDSRITDSNLDSIYRSKLCSEYGEIYLEQKHWKRSINSFDMSIQLNPRDTISYYKKGVALKGLRKYEDAINEYNKALSLDSCYADAYYGRGVAYRHLDEIDLATNDLEKAIEINPREANYPIYLGYIYSKVGKHKKALIYHDMAVSIAPDNLEAYLYRGIAHEINNNENLALIDFDEALAIDSTVASVYNSRGILYKNLKQYDKALADYNKALSSSTDNCDIAYLNRGYLYTLTKNYRKAIKDYDVFIFLMPENTNGYYYKGLTLFYQKKYALALKNFSLVSTKDSERFEPGLIYRKARSLYFLKEYGMAIKYFDSVLQIDNSNAQTMHRLKGLAYQKLGNLSQAENSFNLAIKTDPDYLQGYKSRGAFFLKTGKYNNSISDFHQAISIDNSYFYGYSNLFFAYFMKYWLVVAILLLGTFVFFERKRLKAFFKK